MPVATRTINFKTAGDNDVLDVTDQVQEALTESGLASGTVTVFVPGSTAGVTTVEFEPGMVADLKRFLDETVPASHRYAHNRGGETNGHAHVRAAILGPSLAIPFTRGRLSLGTWQQVAFVDCDDRPRTRTLLIQMVGE